MNKNNQKLKRAERVRAKLHGTKEMPRLSVFRSNYALSAQLIDDVLGITLLGITERHVKAGKGNKSERAKELGIHIAKLANAKKITKAIFDRGNYKYHGRIKAFAEGAREGGLQF